MKHTPALNQDQLVRTTLRLPKRTYQHLRMLSLNEEATMQAILDRAIWQYQQRQAAQRAESILKHTVVFKTGKFPKQRNDYYDEYFDRKFGPRR